MNRLTPVVKNLLIINVGVFLVASLFSLGNVNSILGLYYYGSPAFQPFQIFSYMFAHGDFMHLAFNMLGLFFLGPLLEQFWGTQRFLTFYVACGIGAGIIYNIINFFQISPMKSAMERYNMDPNPDSFYEYVDDYYTLKNARIYQLYSDFYENPSNTSLKTESQQVVREIYNLKLRIPMVGASGAIYGLLMAIALLFPNTVFMLLFPPIPIKAKWLALILGGISLYSGFSSNPGDNVAHFAHLGGMIFAFIMIRLWNKNRSSFY